MGLGNEIRDCRGKQDVGLGSRNLRIKLGGFREISITYHLELYKERSSWSLFECSGDVLSSRVQRFFKQRQKLPLLYHLMNISSTDIMTKELVRFAFQMFQL